MPTSTATQKQTEGTNAWPGWEIQVLHDLGAPVSQANVGFLQEWQMYEHSEAKNNPLNITAPAGSGSINSAGVQNYSSRQQGARYTAQVISGGNYPTIYKMLKGDNVGNTFLHHTPDLVKELNLWGSKSFAEKIHSGSESVLDKAGDVAHQAADVITAPVDAIKWVFKNWDRILFVIGGAVLIIIGIIVLVKGQSKNTFTFERGE